MTPTHFHFGPLASAAMLHPSGLHVGLATQGVVSLKDHEELNYLLPPVISNFTSHEEEGPKPVMDEILRSNGNMRFEFWGRVAGYLRKFSPAEFQKGITARLDMEDPNTSWNFRSDSVSEHKAQMIYQRNRKTLDSRAEQKTMTEIWMDNLFWSPEKIPLKRILGRSPASVANQLFKQFVPRYQNDRSWVTLLDVVKHTLDTFLGENWPDEDFSSEQWGHQLSQCGLAYKMTSENTAHIVKIPTRNSLWFDAQQQLMECITPAARVQLVAMWQKEFYPFLSELIVDEERKSVKIGVWTPDPDPENPRLIQVEASDADILERLPYTAKSWFYMIFGLSIQPPSKKSSLPRAIDLEDLIAFRRQSTETIAMQQGHRSEYPQWQKDIAQHHKMILRLAQELRSQEKEMDAMASEFIQFGHSIMLLDIELQRVLTDDSDESWIFWISIIRLLNRHITLASRSGQILISRSLFSMMEEPVDPNNVLTIVDRLKKMPTQPRHPLAFYLSKNEDPERNELQASPKKHIRNPDAAKARAEKTEARRQEKSVKAREEATRRAEEADRLAALRAEEAAAAAVEEEALRIEKLRQQRASAAQVAADLEDAQRKRHFSVFQSHGTRLEKMIGDIEEILLELCVAGKVSEEGLGASWLALNGGDKQIPLAPELKLRREKLRLHFDQALQHPHSVTHATDEILKSSHALLEEAMMTKRSLTEAANSR